MRVFKLLIVSCLGLLVATYPFLLLLLLIILGFDRKNADVKWMVIFSLVFILVGVGLRLITIPFSGSQVGLVVKAEKNYVIIQTVFSRYYVSIRGNSLTVGDIIEVNGISQPFHFSVLEQGFDFNQYLNNLGVNQQISNPKLTTIWENPIRPQFVRAQLVKSYSITTRTLVDSLLFNNTDYQVDTIHHFARLDLMYLLSTSGIHIHFFSYLVTLIISSFTAKKIYQETIPIILLIPLWLLNLDRFIFYRIFLVNGFRLYNRYKLNNHYDYLTIISVVGLVFIILNPWLIFNMSYYVSFGLTIYIYLIRPLVKRAKKRLQPLVMSLSIFLFLLPLRVIHSHFLPLLILPYQVIMTPLVGMFFVLALISAILGGRGAGILNYLSSMIGQISKTFANVNPGIGATQIDVYGAIMIYLSIFIALYALITKHKPIKRSLFVGLVFSLLVIFVPYESLTTKSVTFINVGQGDAILIQNHRSTILIDTGGSASQDIALSSLIPYLRTRKINQLDCVIISHDDIDHNGALKSLDANFRVKKIIDNHQSFPLQVGDLTLTSLNDKTPGGADNDNSLVVYLEFIGKKWLFMGDASLKVEQKILSANPNLRADVIKLGHHGSNTSSSHQFLSMIQPEEAIIMVGAKNIYGHPHQEILTRLRQLKIKVRRTDQEGSIMYKSYGF